MISHRKFYIHIKEISPELGGGINAYIPQLGNYTFRGIGETLEEALYDLREITRIWITRYFVEGRKLSKKRGEPKGASHLMVMKTFPDKVFTLHIYKRED